MGPRAPKGRIAGALLALLVVAGTTVALEGTSSARPIPRVTPSTCEQRPWLSATYRAGSTPEALAQLVFDCLRLEYPSTYRHDEVGLVSLNAYPWFQNVNEFGLTSTVQKQLAKLGMPPITLEDGPGGLITQTNPSPTQLPNELALGATFDTSMATEYGNVLGAEAARMGYDGVQAPDLNLVRVPSWGRASESFGESPVLAGEMGAAEAVAIESHHVMSILKHFGPYSQETDRKELNQLVTEKAYQELYIRPFTFALRALGPLLREGNHAVGIMCSYGNVNATKACRSPELAQELAYVGENALVRSDLDVKVNPSALLLNGVDLIKPMDTGELVGSLKEKAVTSALDEAVEQIFETEFADGLVNGKVTSAQRHPLTPALVASGRADATQLEERAAVLLKDSGILPLAHGAGRIAVIGDANTANTCRALAASITRSLGAKSSCVDTSMRIKQTKVFASLPYANGADSRTRTLVAPSSGPFVLSVTTLGNTEVSMNGVPVSTTRGDAEFQVQRTALVTLTKGQRYTFKVSWRGLAPKVWLLAEWPTVHDAVEGAKGARAAIVLAYDLPREGMDRNTLALPGVQPAVISSVAAKTPTVVLLASDGAVTMPWLSKVDAVLEVWNPTGMVETDRTLSKFVQAYTSLLDGQSDPSGRLPVTFPVTDAQSPMGVQGFWPGYYGVVNLGLPPDGGVGIGYDWYRLAGWPVLFPFGYGLSYTTYQLEGGALSSGAGGLQVSVSVRDTGDAAGIEPVQLYADWPSAAGEPHDELVGFGTVSFTKQNALAGTVKKVVITVSPDALTTWQGGTMHVLKGDYCFQASTYDGDPHSWTTGQLTLAPGTGQSVVGPPYSPLTEGSCPT